MWPAAGARRVVAARSSSGPGPVERKPVVTPGPPTAQPRHRRLLRTGWRLPPVRRAVTRARRPCGPAIPSGEVLVALTAALSTARDAGDVAEAVSRVTATALRTSSARLVVTGPGGATRPVGRHADGVDLPLLAGGVSLGSLVLRWERPPAMTPDRRLLLTAVAACTAHALRRCQVEVAGRTLTRSLRNSVRPALPRPRGQLLAGRYLPAGPSAVLGGDWFDGFVARDGTTTLVIGDVTGHGPAAAGEMTQLRGLLGNAAATTTSPPSRALRELDRAIDRLALPAGATALVVRIEQDAELRRRGAQRLRWSNAGHPAPLLRTPGGEVVELAPAPELCLGVDATARRSDHVLDVPEGSTLLLFTDGLVESRRRDLTAGTAMLGAELAASGDHPLDALLDRLVDRVADPGAEDDVALLAARLGRPSDAG